MKAVNKRFFTKLSITSGLVTTFLATSPALAAPLNTSDPGALVGSIAVAAVGIGGGIALLLIVYGGIMFSLSRGDPTKVEEAQQIITNALGGLALIVFATLILQIIGHDVFELPGFPTINIK